MPIVKGIVREVRRHGPEAVTVGFAAEGFSYRPGQHVKIDPYQFPGLRGRLREREAQQGRREWPAYFSLSSDGTESGFLEVTPRRPRDGREALVASYLVEHAAPGMEVMLEGPGGRYCLPEGPPAGIEAFLHVCAGSGVAPNRGMIRHAQARDWPQRQLLVLQEREPGEVLFQDDWIRMGNRSGFRFRPVYSRSAGERLSADLLSGAAAGFLSPESTLAFVCGPNDPRRGGPGFCDLAVACLRSLGWPADRILRERG